MAGVDGMAWDRQVGEPARWFGRFTEFRQMGRNRSLLAIFHAEQLGRGRAPDRLSRTVPGKWNRVARDWDWWGRAIAWDDALLKQEEEALQETAKESRTRLRESMVEAVDTLVKLLSSKDDRVRLGAATQILDRTGVEASSQQEVAHTLRRARELSDDELLALIAGEMAAAGHGSGCIGDCAGVCDGVEGPA